jgi:SAM-dependent methyltransferase
MFCTQEQKQCRVVGLDLSLRMLEFARESNPFQDVTFVHKDATDLAAYEHNAFDYATMLMVIHELNKSQQALVLRETLRQFGSGQVEGSPALAEPLTEGIVTLHIYPLGPWQPRHCNIEHRGEMQIITPLQAGNYTAVE